MLCTILAAELPFSRRIVAFLAAEQPLLGAGKYVEA